MQAVCQGVAEEGGFSIGLLPEGDARFANPFVSVAIATGIGEARNALIARAALCLVTIGNSYGTLAEVARAAIRKDRARTDGGGRCPGRGSMR